MLSDDGNTDSGRTTATQTQEENERSEEKDKDKEREDRSSIDVECIQSEVCSFSIYSAT
jgi:hypothetical protein